MDLIERWTPRCRSVTISWWNDNSFVGYQIREQTKKVPPQSSGTKTKVFRFFKQVKMPTRPCNWFRSIYLCLSLSLSASVFGTKRGNMARNRIKVRGRWERCLTPLVRCRSCSTDTICTRHLRQPVDQWAKKDRPAIDPIVIFQNSIHFTVFWVGTSSSQVDKRTEPSGYTRSTVALKKLTETSRQLCAEIKRRIQLTIIN